ncbi:MAG: hypothetical protein BMS9Abin39_1072 [Ignavibacteria bacterium]|nr:MAG: hypothetical protein BMS9Abin39_1072 [Ignavibacteria bacterium]
MNNVVDNNIALQSEKKLNIIMAGSEMDSKWDDYVHKHADGTIYHNSAWLDVIEKESGQKVLKLICTDENDNVMGIFPLQYTAGFPFGIGGVPGSKRLSSLPRTPIGGPLTSNVSVTKTMIEKAISIVGDDSNRLLQIKSYATDLNEKVEKLIKYLWREIYLKEIPDYPDEIRFGNSRNHAAVKRAVNKAKKNGVTFRIAGSLTDLTNWYPLYLDTMRFHSTPARSFSFYKNLWNQLKPKGLMQLVLAELEENGKIIIIAGSVLFFYNKVVTYAFNGSSRKHFELRPNDILHWEAIFEAQKEGYKYYDLGEVSKDHSGLAAYKKKWGSTVWEMYHYYYPKPSQLEEEELDSGTSGGMKEKIWQSLPLGLTAKLGEMVYKKL